MNPQRRPHAFPQVVVFSKEASVVSGGHCVEGQPENKGGLEGVGAEKGRGAGLVGVMAFLEPGDATATIIPGSLPHRTRPLLFVFSSELEPSLQAKQISLM